ncbi:hypothetical protein ACQKOH_06680 [Sphingomonas sp. NPDC092331]|jgi:hypothetical protein|uniref:hypothetical protein n=1 Tax=unclassified Sphingomonas TaxID=196159 RepID=UPI0031F54AAF
MAERPRLYFCFPYHGVGGVSLLFLRVGEALARAGLADVTLVDYADGYMARHRDPGLTRLAEYADDGALAIPGDAIAIFQSMTPWSIFPGLRPDPATRLLFWNCHPFNLVPTLPGIRTRMQRSPALAKLLLATLLRGFAGRMRRFVRTLLAGDSLVFMDEPNLVTTRDLLGIAVPEPRFLPIPAPEVEPRGQRAPSRRLHVAWVGRIVDFKYHILEHALRALDEAQPALARPVLVTVIGSGEYLPQLREAAAGLRNIEIRFVDELSPDALDHFLRAEVDLLLAMGTAALEGAKLAIPTLLLDIAYGPVAPDYRFTWLHERQGYALGDMANRPGAPREPGSMGRRLAELAADPDGVGQAALQHFRRFHALSVVAAGLISHVVSARCCWGDLQAAGLTDRGLAYSLFTGLRKRFGRK